MESSMALYFEGRIHHVTPPFIVGLLFISIASAYMSGTQGVDSGDVEFPVALYLATVGFLLVTKMMVIMVMILWPFELTVCQEIWEYNLYIACSLIPY